MNSVNGNSRQKTLSEMNTLEVAFFLSYRGISQPGVDSMKDNCVNGAMLLDFCEEDVKDVFTIFKDRFLIRKLLREIRSSSQTTRSEADKVSPSSADTSTSFDNNKRTHCDNVEAYVEHSQGPSGATDMSKRVKISENNFIRSNFPKLQTLYPHLDLSRKHHDHVSTSFMPTIVSVHSANKSYPQQSNFPEANTKCHVKQEHTETRVNPSSVSSSTKVAHIFHKYMDVSPSDRGNVMSVNRQSITSNERISSSKPEAIVIEDEDASDVIGNVSSSDNVSSDNATDLALYYSGYKTAEADGGQNDFLIVSSTISQYSADQLLEKKVVRTKPTEAQRLGHILIRNAAQSAKIWNTAPLLKDIPEHQKETFFNFVFAAAPQLKKKPDLVWCRIREALQNRRKYLMDKETGKRYPKSPEAKPPSSETISQPEEPDVIEIDVKPNLSPIEQT
ncbi:hypothetical protein ScPMuIL_007983 [Solemya velum]